MKSINDTASVVHIGRKIEKLRTLVGISQQELGDRLGVSKQAISKMERKQKMGDEKLGEVSSALGFTSEAVQHFTEETLVFFIENMYDQTTAYSHNFECIYNPLDKVVELYERLLQLELEKVQLLLNKLNDKH